MTTPTGTATSHHRLRVRDDRPPQIEPAMSNEVDVHSRVRVTSRWIEVSGKPTIPVSGELHFSRVPRARWEEELRLLVASGVTMVSTYMFWIHHEPVRGSMSFEGDLDVAAFLETADRVGIDVVLRIGPWCHGEVRNGGFPDWVVEAAPRARTNDPEYLRLAADWYRQVAEQVRRFCGPDGRIIGIQLENELYDQPDHLATLKQLARAAGFTAPLWTATGWGGALLPPHEVLPLYSGYADGFWADQGSDWDDSFRDHFTFTHVWDDPGVGGDQRDDNVEIVVRDVDPEFPPATCELGGGMATAYHRRPIARGHDIAAVANVKIANGSLWQGFYMYAGGTNPVDHVQESHATGYPNDLPRFDYDFQAPIGGAGQLGPSLAELREHNAFLAAFGDTLADMAGSLPDGAPVPVHDTQSLRWAVRSDANGGVLFLNTHQPHVPLSAVPGVQLQVEFDDAVAVVPDRPIDIPSGVVARWPVRFVVAGVRIDWATASLAGLVGQDSGATPTLVLHAHPGIEPRISVGGRTTALTVGESVVLDGTLRVLLVDDDQAENLWYLDGELIDSTDAIWREDATLVARAGQEPVVRRWADGEWLPMTATAPSPGEAAAVPLEPLRDAAEVPPRYGEFMGRSSAPDDEQFEAVAAVWRIALPASGNRSSGDRIELDIDFEGDVAQLRVDGVLIADRFWNGLSWRVDVTELDPSQELTLHIAPLASHSVIDLDSAVRERLDRAGTLCAVTTVSRLASVRWEISPL